MTRVLQIMPAHGEVAVFKNDDESTDTLPVVCWALIERTYEDDTPMQFVVGMAIEAESLYLVECDDLKGFVEYRYS